MRGCQKKVIYMKNTGSRHFEGAYFVLRPNAEGISDTDMIEEANRIINENFKKDGGRRHRPLYRYIIAFSLGAALSLLISLAVKILA